MLAGSSLRAPRRKGSSLPPILPHLLMSPRGSSSPRGTKARVSRARAPALRPSHTPHVGRASWGGAAPGLGNLVSGVGNVLRSGVWSPKSKPALVEHFGLGTLSYPR